MEYFKRHQGSLLLIDTMDNKQPTRMMSRSIWGLVRVYNKLGGSLQCANVKDFQKLLQNRVKRVVQKQLWAEWDSLYSPRSPGSTSRQWTAAAARPRARSSAAVGLPREPPP